MTWDRCKYVIVSPVRDEEKFVEGTIKSIVGQSIRPSEWIIVNDGSTDRTGDIVDGYARQHPWIRVCHLPNRGFRKPGGGVVEAFNEGYKALRCDDWEFIVKLDGDLILAPDYFERCLDRFREDRRLGIGGGSIYHVLDGKESVEHNPQFHVRGATKIYRRECWEAIGGLWVAPGWDTIDEVKANMLGWTSRTFPEIKLHHQRLTGTAESRWKDLVKIGRARYVSGYHPLFMASSCILRSFRQPYLWGSAAIVYGYASGYLRRLPRVNDPLFIKYIRGQQVRRLLGMRTIWR
ncbi:MAG: glycosyltransferase family A protein [Candidatus Sulfotelmatobacter sp.]